MNADLQKKSNRRFFPVVGVIQPNRKYKKYGILTSAKYKTSMLINSKLCKNILMKNTECQHRKNSSEKMRRIFGVLIEIELKFKTISIRNLSMASSQTDIRYTQNTVFFLLNWLSFYSALWCIKGKNGATFVCLRNRSALLYRIFLMMSAHLPSFKLKFKGNKTYFISKKRHFFQRFNR